MRQSILLAVTQNQPRLPQVLEGRESAMATRVTFLLLMAAGILFSAPSRSADTLLPDFVTLSTGDEASVDGRTYVFYSANRPWNLSIHGGVWKFELRPGDHYVG